MYKLINVSTPDEFNGQILRFVEFYSDNELVPSLFIGIPDIDFVKGDTYIQNLCQDLIANGLESKFQDWQSKTETSRTIVI